VNVSQLYIVNHSVHINDNTDSWWACGLTERCYKTVTVQAKDFFPTTKVSCDILMQSSV